MRKIITPTKYKLTIRGIPLIVEALYESGYPATREDPGEPEGFEICAIRATENGPDLFLLLEESPAMSEIVEELFHA